MKWIALLFFACAALRIELVARADARDGRSGRPSWLRFPDLHGERDESMLTQARARERPKLRVGLAVLSCLSLVVAACTIVAAWFVAQVEVIVAYVARMV